MDPFDHLKNIYFSMTIYRYFISAVPADQVSYPMGERERVGTSRNKRFTRSSLDDLSPIWSSVSKMIVKFSCPKNINSSIITYDIWCHRNQLTKCPSQLRYRLSYTTCRKCNYHCYIHQIED